MDLAQFDQASAERIAKVVRYVEKQIRNESGHRGGYHPPGTIWYWGKPTANIARNSSGEVEIWSGDPGSETATGTKIQNVYNHWWQTASEGKWCRISNNAYLFQIDWCCNNALEIDATLTASLAIGGTATADVNSYANGDNPGASVTLESSQMQTGTLASGIKVYATWNDISQKYRVRGWGC